MTQKREEPTAALQKWGWASIGVNISLTALNLAIAHASGSLAVAAEMVHNVEREPTVVAIHSLIGRNAGRYRFLEAEVDVRVRELERADLIGRRIERNLRDEISHLERAVIHVKPARKDALRAALPIERPNGPLSRHFGTAPAFLLVDKRRTDGQVISQTVVTNPFSGEPRGRGIKVAHWLIDQEVDVLLTTDDVRDKGPGHALGEAGVDVIITKETAVEELLEQGWNSVG